MKPFPHLQDEKSKDKEVLDGEWFKDLEVTMEEARGISSDRSVGLPLKESEITEPTT